METAILVIYGAALLLLALFGLHRFYLLWLFHRHRHDRVVEPPLADPAPLVTIQLPIYNELYVVERLIRATCAVEYPRDRLEVQVLDDSTDETSDVARRVCEEERANGTNVVHLRRPARAGFKAGALAHGLACARGELIAVFDADFVPDPAFLARTVPHFSDAAIGMVQTRWEHLNRGYSLLTEAQSVLLDGHFVIEQDARYRAGRFFNFNGTGGVWRRAAIEDSGGWQCDTLTEDLDLSYRAQIRGWRFVFLAGETSPAELPVEMRALKSQQRRWARGSIETAAKLLPRVWRGRFPLAVKLEATVHLTNNLAFVALLIPAVMMLPVLSSAWRDAAPSTGFALANAALFLAATLSVATFYGASQRAIRLHWLRRLALLPGVMAICVGLSVNNSLAVLQALARRPGEFVRTPKYAIVSQDDTWRGKRYTKRFDPLALAEIGLAANSAAALLLAVESGFYLFVPFALLCLSGFLYVGGISLIEQAGSAATARGARAAALAGAVGGE